MWTYNQNIKYSSLPTTIYSSFSVIIGLINCSGVGVGVGVNVGVTLGVGVLVGVGVTLGVGVLVGVVVTLGVGVGVFVGIGIIGVTIGKDSNLKFGGALFWLKVLGKTFCPVVICPGTINRDPLASVPDLFLKSNPSILFY